MKKLAIKDKKEHSIPLSIATGVAVAAVIGIVGAIISALLINAEHVPEGAVSWMSVLTIFLASAIGTLIAAKSSRKQLVVVCGLTAAAFFLFQLGCAIMFFDSQFNGIGQGSLAVVAGTVVSILLCLKQGGGKIRKKIKLPR